MSSTLTIMDPIWLHTHAEDESFTTVVVLGVDYGSHLVIAWDFRRRADA